jgi:hypothetical protein
MEMTKPEVAAILAAVNQVEEAASELSALELTMVGGGVGDILLG